MRRSVRPLSRFTTTLIASCLLGVAGCSIAGSWRTVAVDPTGSVFPVDTVTFDRNHNYTATWSQEGERRTGIGEYRWNGFKLEVMQAGNRSRAYDARLRLDGKLLLSYGKGDAKVTATLARAATVGRSADE